MIQPQFEKTFEGWRGVARDLIQKSIPPGDIHWSESLPLLISDTQPAQKRKPLSGRFVVPAEFLDLAEAVAYARDEDRWDLLYRILYRLQFENPNLMKIAVDPDIHQAQLLQKAVRRDIHKMHAFVRFKKTTIEGEEAYVAWHKAEHLTVRPGTPFFARRFGDRRWSIFTPEESAHWDLKTLTFGPGMEQHQFTTVDQWDDVWKTYYKSIFNPARIKIKMMKSEMSPKYWASMPETSLIHELVRESPKRLQQMALNHNRAAVVDPSLPLAQLRELSKSCTACPLFGHATQTVFGNGTENAEIMIVGEQPGDQEDLAGLPFVGPSGKILDQALSAAGLSRDGLYLTNAVKHFKWVRSDKVRLHQKPTGGEMHACKPWLEAEIARVKPKIIIALGATAATAVMGRLPKITTERGKVFTEFNVASAVIISWHPAAILRAPSEQESQLRQSQLANDLALAKSVLQNQKLVTTP
ncbi:MAG: UdgX family uracil-DNA binding protein [Bdellovibrionaceae bacterium]|nr:UdgX family uracil-DNA binding protein [Pseudobdellovibrionaceae bacterium]